MNNNKLFVVISILYLLLSISPALQAQAQQVESAWQQHIQPGETPQGLTHNQWGNIQQQINAAKYRAHPDNNGGYRADNPEQGWQIQYAADGTTTLTPSNNQGKPYYLAMKLTAIGYQTLQALQRPQTISQQDFTVSYQWNEFVREKWINSAQQLEQWFDIARRPEGAGKRLPLTVQMILNSELKISQDGNNIQFTNPEGTDITYDKLKVWDSTGRELPSRMQLAGNILSLLVEDSTAKYPLTIDPSFRQQAFIKASNTEADDAFGFSVAISGDTLVVGAPEEKSNSTGVNGDQNDNSAEDAGAVYVFIYNGGKWTQQAYLKASNNPEFGDMFGFNVAISGDTIVVESFSRIHVFTRHASEWTPQAFNADIKGRVAISGDTLAVGTSEAVYIYIRSEGTWSQQAYLQASNSDTKDSFGRSVAIFEDTLVVGATGEDSNSIGVDGDQNDNSAENSGAAYIFTRSDTTWIQQAYLKASNTGTNDLFGISVAISGDTVVVGAFEEDSNSTGVNGDQTDNSIIGSGAVYVYIRNGVTWSQQAYLKASNTGFLDRFGRSVAISGDTLLVGTPYEESSSPGVNGDQSNNSAVTAGVAYAFIRNDSTWTQQAYLKASNTDARDRFGESVAISEDILVVGAAVEGSNSTGVNGDQSNNLEEFSGAAYVFEMKDVNSNGETLSIPIQTGSDDAEENLNDGDISLVSSDLELTQDGVKPQVVGLRFPLNIPAGATILNASIQFTADEVSFVPTDLSISAEVTTNALTFSGLELDISSRPLTAAAIQWRPAAWTLKAESGPGQATPDLSTIVQEITNQDDWAQGNSIAFIISGNGMREAESFEGTAPPVLQVEFLTNSPKAPVAVHDGTAKAVAYTTGINQQLIVANGADDIVERNDRVGFPMAEVSSADEISAEGGIVSVNADGSFSYAPAVDFVGVDSFIYTLENTEGLDSATVYIRVEPIVIHTKLTIPVAMGSDDAEEELVNGNIRLASSDLELIRDDELVVKQQVGVRFQGLTIPLGATIIKAYIQYTADERHSEPTTLTVFGEASANALTYSNTRFDISDRMVTAASVAWAPAAWNTHEQSLRTQTPDLSTIVQEIVDMDEWQEGNAIAFITTGTGKRVAESYDGTAAPTLHLQYTVPAEID